MEFLEYVKVRCHWFLSLDDVKSLLSKRCIFISSFIYLNIQQVTRVIPSLSIIYWTSTSTSSIAKIVSFQLGLGFWSRMWLLPCVIKTAWWMSLRVYGSNVCCGLGFGRFRLFCLWNISHGFKKLSLHVSSAGRRVAVPGGCFGASNAGIGKLNPDFSCDSFTFFYPCSLQCCLNVRQGSWRSSSLVLNRVCQSPFHPVVWLGI